MRMGWIIRLLTSLSFLVAVCFSTLSAAAYADEKGDADLMQRACAGSPWAGPWEVLRGGNASGTAEITFSCEGGKFRGTLLSTGSTAGAPQELRFVRVENGAVKYQTRFDVDYELVLNEEGKLAGKGQGRAIETKIILSPSKK